MLNGTFGAQKWQMGKKMADGKNPAKQENCSSQAPLHFSLGFMQSIINGSFGTVNEKRKYSYGFLGTHGAETPFSAACLCLCKAGVEFAQPYKLDNSPYIVLYCPGTVFLNQIMQA